MSRRTAGAASVSDLHVPPATARRAPRPGSARAALAHRAFRIVWLGQLGSSVGSWMQTFAVGVFMDRLTGKGLWVGLVTFAQLVPMLVFPIPAGVLADRVDRRTLLLALQSTQLAFATALGVLALADRSPSRLAVISLVLAGGIANSMNAPAYSATVPSLVHREDLAGAISLNSAAINGSRVIGPVLGGLLYPVLGPGWLYLLNALTFVFVIAALARVRLPAPPERRESSRLLAGIGVVRSDPVLHRLLTSLALFSFLSLPFISVWPTLTRRQFSLTSASSVGTLYAVFGLGALTGSLAVAGRYVGALPRPTLTRAGFAGFAAMMAVIAATTRVTVAMPAFFVLGACYFGTTTAMLTILQRRLTDDVRGRVMSLWFMAFGGTVALCGPVFGPLLDRLGPRPILVLSAVAAAFLSLWCRVTDAPNAAG